MAAAKKTPTGPKKTTAAQRKKAAGGKRKTTAATKPSSAETTTPPPKTTGKPLHIVGIGSSAGGLEALKDFFQDMPADSGLAFVLVPHLDPSSKSIMHELLQKYTSMPVEQVKDGTRVEADHVYIIPPDQIMGISDGALYLMKSLEERGRRHPIDYFFRSLAEDQKDNSVGIILSGTGAEGVLGLKAIKGEGGLVMAQDPDSAKFDGMPLNAIGTGLVDFIMSPHEMPAELVGYTGKIAKGTVAVAKEPAGPTREDIQKILSLLHKKIGHDFSLYKPKTISRRIERRMALNQIEKIDTYIRYLHDHPGEIDLLFRELLIRVTNFFRDPGAFHALQEEVLPKLTKDRAPNRALRVWVPACSTGEEAYSIAIVIQEYLQKNNQYIKAQVFATDIDDTAVESARRGVYPESISVDVSQERLHKFFVKENGMYRVNKEIRELVIFATQNAVKDPPLSRMDLICCRNLLIYLTSELQARLLSIFHYALTPGGILFLGTSETIGPCAELYEALDSKWKFFQAAGKAEDQMLLPTGHIGPEGMESAPFELHEKTLQEQHSISELSSRMLLDIYSPASAVIREDGTILYFSGRTGKYLEPAPGRANLNIFRMARQGLKNALLEAVKRVSQGQKERYQKRVPVKNNGATIHCNVRVIGIRKPEHLKGLMMVVFEEAREPVRPQKGKKGDGGGPDKQSRVEELEEELHSVKEDLQSTIEELETSNEELQSANEELQSTNEELETSREELQSVNEELMTVNAEAQERIDMLTSSSNDMKNLLSSMEIATLFLDLDLRIKRFTPAAVRVFKLIPADIGRPIGDIVNNLNYTTIYDDMHKVLDTLIHIEKQVPDHNGFWYMIKILPYRTHNNVIDGVVLTLVDISQEKLVEAALADTQETRMTILNRTDKGFVMIDRESGSIIGCNEEFQRLTGRDNREMQAMRIWDLVPENRKEETKKFFTRKRKGAKKENRQEELYRLDRKKVGVELNCREIGIGGRKYIQCLVQATRR